MKTVLLAGGKGTRISELTSGSNAIPKPMVKVDGKPLLWHIMSSYARFGFNDFVVAGGHLQDQIKDYFLKFALVDTTISVNTRTGEHRLGEASGPDWNVTVVNTGNNTMTGGRLLRIKDYVDDTFFFTYGDGVADVNISELLDFHKKHGKLCTVTAVPHVSQYGLLKINDDGLVNSFVEKPVSHKEFVSAGFFVCDRSVFDFIDDDMTVWEQDPMKRLLAEDQLQAYRHSGFWKSVDTTNDLSELNKIAEQGQCSWLDDIIQ